MTTSPATWPDRLVDAARSKQSWVCCGLDPVFERLPAECQAGRDAADAQAASDALAAFSLAVLEAVTPAVCCVKIQAACFERYRAPGVAAYHRVIHAARDAGLLVIADAKRGDIGVSAAHYAAGGLADAPAGAASDDVLGAPGPDAITLNGYLGADALQPFLDVAAAQGKGAFVLVRTSNPGGDALQTLRLADGRTVAEAMADLVADAGRGPGLIGACGMSAVGAVVGATQAGDAPRLRARMPEQIFLVPGFGAQGGSADDVRACFNADGEGAVITASRSILYAFAGTDASDWRAAIATAARETRDAVEAVRTGNA